MAAASRRLVAERHVDVDGDPEEQQPIEADPLMCHGCGPESEPRRCTPQTPTPNTFTEKPVAITTSK